MFGVISRWLCISECPSDVPFHSAYVSDQYQMYGLNVHDMCDTSLLITCLSVVGPGENNHACVFRWLARLRKWLDNLQAGYFITEDDVYHLLKTLLISFSGANTRVNINESVLNIF